MEIKLFNLSGGKLVNKTNSGIVSSQEFQIDTLPAYAIDHAVLIVNGLHFVVDGNGLSIIGGLVIYDPQRGYEIAADDDVRLQIFYVGIRGYDLFFPRIAITDHNRAERLGVYYQEAEACFKQGAWLSFSLMAGAIFEHMLYHKLGGASQPAKTLKDVNDEARNKGLISTNDHSVIDTIRNHRNVIHCNRLSDPYISRAEAMDARTLLDRLILEL